MDLLFFDTSGLAKRYINEPGTHWVIHVTDAAAGNRIVIAGITRVETLAAIKKRERTGDLSALASASAIHEFLSDLSHQYHIVEVTTAMLYRAMQLVQSHPIKAYDAVQLVAALEVNDQGISLGLPPITFLSADTQLLTAASAEGLAVDNPSPH